MTLYGPDISNVNFGGPDSPDLGAAAAFARSLPGEGFSWLEAKASQGSDFVDPTFATIAEANTLPLAAYHFVDDSDPAAQAANYVRARGGVKAAAMLDFEYVDDDGRPLLAAADYWNVVNAFNAAGVEIALSYYPRWYWGDLGEPDLSQAPGLVQSSYVDGGGYASAIYPGDNWVGWNGYGGAAPIILQFTDQAAIAWLSVDCNAYRGTVADLQEILT